MKTDKNSHDLILQAYLMTAWNHFLQLSWGRFLWYTFLFVMSDGLILAFFVIFYKFKQWRSDRMYEKWLKNKADNG